METNKATKLLIETVVKQYVEENSNEFLDFVEYQKGRKDTLANDFAEFKGTDFLRRAFAEYPTTLDAMLNEKFTPEDLAWFKTKEGQIWFIKKFPVFASGERV